MTASIGTDNAWVRRFHQAPADAPRLICLPFAGGSASYFFPVSRRLAPTVEVLAIQYPGRQDRRAEAPIDAVPEYVDRLLDALGGWTGVPFALFGHSLGATLAFEVARRLEARGVHPLGLFASGRRAPSRHRDEYVHLGSEQEFRSELRELDGGAASVLDDEEMMRAALPSLRADYRAAETYRYEPGPRLECPIVAFTGDDDPKATVDEVRSWGEHTSAAFDCRVYPGGHFFLNAHAPAVLDEVAAHMAQWARS
ncbi:thioesterase II family protein [Actinoplanes subglobosus]|uniref:Thioesterase II family protein n=1 Tax=Actinoplanes subglobosus TaxID=1547892 RepID=A0ABV8J3P0_9ACTN